LLPVRPRRGNAILLLGAVAVATIAGLALHGPIGGVLLVLVAATLVLFSRSAWATTRPEGRPVRLLIVAAIVVIAALKFARKI
jgi:hypothetical protein